MTDYETLRTWEALNHLTVGCGASPATNGCHCADCISRRSSERCMACYPEEFYDATS